MAGRKDFHSIGETFSWLGGSKFMVKRNENRGMVERFSSLKTEKWKENQGVKYGAFCKRGKIFRPQNHKRGNIFRAEQRKEEKFSG